MLAKRGGGGGGGGGELIGNERKCTEYLWLRFIMQYMYIVVHNVINRTKTNIPKAYHFQTVCGTDPLCPNDM